MRRSAFNPAGSARSLLCRWHVALVAAGLLMANGARMEEYAYTPLDSGARDHGPAALYDEAHEAVHDEGPKSKGFRKCREDMIRHNFAVLTGRSAQAIFAKRAPVNFQLAPAEKVLIACIEGALSEVVTSANVFLKILGGQRHEAIAAGSRDISNWREVCAVNSPPSSRRSPRLMSQAMDEREISATELRMCVPNIAALVKAVSPRTVVAKAKGGGPKTRDLTDQFLKAVLRISVVFPSVGETLRGWGDLVLISKVCSFNYFGYCKFVLDHEDAPPQQRIAAFDTIASWITRKCAAELDPAPDECGRARNLALRVCFENAAQRHKGFVTRCNRLFEALAGKPPRDVFDTFEDDEFDTLIVEMPQDALERGEAFAVEPL